MMSLIKVVQEFLTKKEQGGEGKLAPDGMCPTCWGHSEWEGQFYEIVRDKHLKPGNTTYDSFISKIVDKHVNTSHKHENKYICTSCDKEII